MKNLKNMFTAGMLSAVLMVGTASANTGILMSDSSTNSTQCAQDGTKLINAITGIIVLDFVSVGILMSDSAAPGCSDTTRTGILMSD